MDYTYFYIILTIPLLASIIIEYTYKKYNKRNSLKLSGQEIARRILDSNNLEKIHIIEVRKSLINYYDHKHQVMKLSTSIFHDDTITSLSVAAYLSCYLIQDKEKDFYIRCKNSLISLINYLIYSSYIILCIGLLFQEKELLMLSLTLITIIILYQLLSLPLEIYISKKTINQLLDLGLIKEHELEKIKKILNVTILTSLSLIITLPLNTIILYIDRTKK